MLPKINTKLFAPQSSCPKSPFQATKLWNHFIELLQNNVELKKKRWKMKTYEDCFSGSEALQVLLMQMRLSSKFNREVNNEHACQLLQKFLDANVIRDVRDKEGGQFEPDGHLYKLGSQKRGTSSISTSDPSHTTHIAQKSNRLSNTKMCQQDQNAGNFGRKSFRSSKRKPFVSMTNLDLSPRKNDRRASLRSFCNEGLQENDSACDIDSEILTTTASLESIGNRSINDTKTKSAENVAESYFLRSRSVRFHRQRVVRVKKNERFSIYRDAESKRQQSKPEKLPKKRSIQANEDYNDASPRKKHPLYTAASSYVNYAIIASAFEENSKEKSNEEDSTVSPLNPREKDIPTEEIEETWKSVAVASLKQILGNDTAARLIKSSFISGQDVRANGNITKRCVSRCVPDWLLSAMKCLIRWPVSVEESTTLPSYPGFDRDVFNAIKEYYQTSVTAPLIPQHFQLLLSYVLDMISENWLFALATLKYICVLMPHDNRLQLQLLARFINKLSHNDGIQLSLVLLNKEMLVQTFHPLVFAFNEGRTDIEGIRLLAFILDNSEEVFKLPRGLRFQVDHKLAVTHGSLAKQPDNSPLVYIHPKTYCQQVTVEEYSRQAKRETADAVTKLLADVLQDHSMPAKEKKQFLKQFQKTYPDIYKANVPDDNISICSDSSQS